MTPLDSFIEANGIDTAELMRLAEISEEHLARLRDGRTKPPRHVRQRITVACSWLACRHVFAWELFEDVQ